MTEPEISTVRTSRDDVALRERLQSWLARQLPASAEPSVSELSSPSGSGMSSETLLFDATWSRGEGGGSFVARMAPADADLPTFPSYDLSMQARVLKLVGECGVPVPAVQWVEMDPEPLGAPFFVMERLEGRVPPDVPPYVLSGWVAEATEAERRTLQNETIATIAAIHAIDPEAHDVSFLELPVAGDTPLRRHVQNQRDYYAWAAGSEPSGLIDRAFEALEKDWPEETSCVVSWGDSRIGNVMYEGFRPVAILDWEMAALGPRELDLGWLAFMHTFFQKIFEGMGVPGLPDFLRAEDVAAEYARITGCEVPDLRWYETYAAVRHAIIMTRMSERMAHFGQGERASDPDDRFPHRATLEAMLDGSHWGG